MKPIEIYQALVAFNAMLADPTLRDEDKLRIGREALTSLPSPMIAPHSQESLKVAGSLMKRGLDKLEHGSKQGTANAAPAGDDAAADAGRGLPVASLVDAKEPKVKAPKAKAK